MRQVLLACTVLLAAGCDGYSAPPGNTKSDARYEVTRTDIAPAFSRISSIETLKDRQTGLCYAVVTADGIAVFQIECERAR